MELNARSFAFVVLFLGATLILAVGGIVTLAILEKSVPDILSQIATGVITGLIGLLVRTPGQPPKAE